MSCITIALSTHKGGAGKTTSVACFADLLGKQGKKVLLIDTDTQGNLSKRFGYPPQPRQKVTLGDAVKNILGPQEEARPLKDFVQHTENLNIDILPNDDRYANVVKEMLNLVMSGVNSYKLLVDELATLYDYIIFDTKPAVDDEIRQIMMAVKWVIIPMDAADDAIDGANNTMRFVKGCTRGNPNLTVAGIFFNAVNLRSSVAKDYIPQIREAWGELVFDTVIPYSQEAKKAEGMHEPVTEAYPTGKVALAFEDLLKEVQQRVE